MRSLKWLETQISKYTNNEHLQLVFRARISGDRSGSDLVGNFTLMALFIGPRSVFRGKSRLSYSLFLVDLRLA